MTEKFREFTTSPERIAAGFVYFVSSGKPPDVPTYKFTERGANLFLTATTDHARMAMGRLESEYNRVKDETGDESKALANVLSRANLRTLVLAIARYGPTLRNLHTDNDLAIRQALGNALIMEEAKCEKALFAIELGLSPESIPGLSLPIDLKKYYLQRGSARFHALRRNLLNK